MWIAGLDRTKISPTVWHRFMVTFFDFKAEHMAILISFAIQALGQQQKKKQHNFRTLQMPTAFLVIYYHLFFFEAMSQKNQFLLVHKGKKKLKVVWCCDMSTLEVATARTCSNFCTDSPQGHWQVPYITMGWALPEYSGVSVLSDKGLRDCGGSLPLVTT